MRRLLLCLVLVVPTLGLAQTLPEVQPGEPAIDTEVVRAPGPGFWKVTKGDHTLWVLGTVSPVPADMAWNSVPLRAKIATADAVVREPSITVGADIGFFGKLALLPSLVGLRDLPDDARLRDVVPAASYARWSRLKAQYIGNDSTVEGWRPIFAAQRLYEGALKARGLSWHSVVGPAVDEALKARKAKAIVPLAELKIPNPRAAVKAFKSTQLADVRCFDRMLDRVENEMGTMSARADAWASGDIATLRRLQGVNADDACFNAVMSGAFAEKYGLDRLQAQARSKWLTEIDTQMARGRNVVTVLPMRDVLAPDGLVATLAARGYAVEAPNTEALASGAATPASP